MYKCKRCNSYDVQIRTWYNPNTLVPAVDLIARDAMRCTPCGGVTEIINVPTQEAVHELLEQNRAVEARLQALLLPGEAVTEYAPRFAVGEYITHPKSDKTLLVTQVKSGRYSLLEETAGMGLSAEIPAFDAEGWYVVPAPVRAVAEMDAAVEDAPAPLGKYPGMAVLEEAGSHMWVVIARGATKYTLLPFQAPGVPIEPRHVPFAEIDDSAAWTPVPRGDSV